MDHAYTVRCEWDAEVACWVASSDDVPGAAGITARMEALVAGLLDGRPALS
jgi:hypothetical protein